MVKVLVVDDSATERHAMKQLLEKSGHEVITADSGKSGVNSAVENLPDLILMDVVMEDLNGFQATRQISKNESTSGIPVVMVTTKDQKTDILWSKKQGARGYITKPIDEEVFYSVLGRVLNGEEAFDGLMKKAS